MISNRGVNYHQNFGCFYKLYSFSTNLSSFWSFYRCYSTYHFFLLLFCTLVQVRCGIIIPTSLFFNLFGARIPGFKEKETYPNFSLFCKMSDGFSSFWIFLCFYKTIFKFSSKFFRVFSRILIFSPIISAFWRFQTVCPVFRKWFWIFPKVFTSFSSFS